MLVLNFATETDTETIVLLTQHYMAEGAGPQEAAFRTLDRLSGAFALAFLFEGEDDLIVIARKGSPLAVGHGDGEMYVGSDAIALAPLTNQITYLEEGDRAVVTRNTLEIRNEQGTLVNRAKKTIQVDSGQIDKAGHKHFMAKEIAEQPAVIADALAHYLTDTGEIVLPEPGT